MLSMLSLIELPVFAASPAATLGWDRALKYAYTNLEEVVATLSSDRK